MECKVGGASGDGQGWGGAGVEGGAFRVFQDVMRTLAFVLAIAGSELSTAVMSSDVWACSVESSL